MIDSTMKLLRQRRGERGEWGKLKEERKGEINTVVRNIMLSMLPNERWRYCCTFLKMSPETLKTLHQFTHKTSEISSIMSE